MTYKEFLLKAQQAGMTLNENEGTYYWNLWQESRRQARKHSVLAEAGIIDYIKWMKKQ